MIKKSEICSGTLLTGLITLIYTKGFRMATSNTTTFNLDIDEIIEEAHERAGLGRSYSGGDYRTARRSLNLLAQEFSNRGVNLWTVQEVTQATVKIPFIHTTI